MSYMCGQCGDLFQMSDELDNHLEVHHQYYEEQEEALDYTMATLNAQATRDAYNDNSGAEEDGDSGCGASEKDDAAEFKLITKDCAMNGYVKTYMICTKGEAQIDPRAFLEDCQDILEKQLRADVEEN